jgi:hypothetical protein
MNKLNGSDIMKVSAKKPTTAHTLDRSNKIKKEKNINFVVNKIRNI